MAATQAEEAAAQRSATHTHTHSNCCLYPLAGDFKALFICGTSDHISNAHRTASAPHTLLSLSLSLSVFLALSPNAPSLCRPPTNDRRRHRRVTVAPKLKSRQKYEQNGEGRGKEVKGLCRMYVNYTVCGKFSKLCGRHKGN